MLLTPLRWIAKNISTLLLAFVLAVVVWVSAVVSADPNEERIVTRTVSITGKNDSLQLIGEVPTQVRLTLKAPKSILNQIANNPSRVQAWIDLSGVSAGEHTLPVEVRWDIAPIRLLNTEPNEVSLLLEPIISQTFPITLIVSGDPPLGYKKGQPQSLPDEITVSGPASAVGRVAEVRARLSVAGASDTVKTNVTLQAIDQNGETVAGISLLPKEVSVTQPISLQGGYKNVVVKVVTLGQIANGYRLTNISVTPPNVTVFSTNPQLVNQIPGFVETMPVDLSNLSDDIDMRVALNLPADVTLVGEQSVLVQVGVAAIEGSLTVSLPVEALGLPPNMKANISPAVVDVIVAGPLPVLDTLTTASFRAVVDLTGFEPGTYQISPVVDLAPEQVRIQNIIPETVEVTVLVPTQIAPDAAQPTGTPPGPASGSGANEDSGTRTP